MADHPDVLRHMMNAQFATGLRVPVLARYDRRDPLALRFQFLWGVEWLFARDLLVEALERGSAGDGDVRFRTDKSGVDYMWLVLDSPDGHTELRFEVSDLTDLVVGMRRLVPADGIPVDWDTELRTLGGWGP